MAPIDRPAPVHAAAALGRDRPEARVFSSGETRGAWLSNKRWDQNFLPWVDGGFEIGLFVRHELAALVYAKILPLDDRDEALEYFAFRDEPEGPVLEIAYVWVYPQFRGLGLSKRLIEEAVTVGLHWGVEWVVADVYSQVIYRNFHAALKTPRQARGGAIRKTKGKEALTFDGEVTRTVDEFFVRTRLDPLPELTDKKWNSPIRTYGFQLGNKRMAKMIWKVKS